MVAFILLVVMAVIGVSYWSVSRLTTDQIVKESHRIKARNLAQAGVEKVRINMLNQYTMGNFDLSYPGKFNKDGTDKEYAIDFGDGRYRVESVTPWKLPKTNQKAFGLDYYKNRVKIGIYDIWEVTVTGEVPGSGIQARIRTLIKVVRSTIQY